MLIEILIYAFIQMRAFANCEGTQEWTKEWNPENLFASCVDAEHYSNCDQFANCLAENVLKFAKDANEQCLQQEPKLRCNIAPTAFVTLEKLREFLMDSETGRRCPAALEVQRLCSDMLFDSEADNNIKLAASFNKYFLIASKKLRDDSLISKEISDAELSRNFHSLLALVVSFGLPGVFSICEPSHLKTTLFLQILSLTAVSFYQFVRKGLMWTLFSIGACFLVLLIQFGMLYLCRARYREEKPLIFKE